MDTIFNQIGSQRTLGQEIVRQIEKSIREKKLQAGQKLPTEKELCAMFGVSRTALREALQILSARGLITIRKGSGMFVNDFTTDHASKPMSLYLELNFDSSYVLHITDLRQIMEPEAARLAALNHSEADIVYLRKNLQDYLDNQDDVEKRALLDLQFHTRIMEASGNPLLPLMMEPIYSQMPRIKTLVVSKVPHDPGQDAFDYHSGIVDCIEARNPKKAHKAMVEHMQMARDDVLKLIEILRAEEVLEANQTNQTAL
ncbi:MAG: FadR/GntR family transcriptional regulator [Calditrichia bacterium]